MHPRAAELIRLLELAPHPEGGYFRETFRSPRMVKPSDRRPSRPALTTIHFLLAAGQHSAWHRVDSDEAWHHAEGNPLELFWLDEPGGKIERRILGRTGGGARPAAVVPAGCWQAARPAGAYALAGCTVGPGFDFADFRMLRDHPAEAARLLRLFPQFPGGSPAPVIHPGSPVAR